MSGIAERLAVVRRTAGVGVRGFAAAVARATGYRVSHTSVANYESGTTVPAAYAVAVSQAFAINLEWLMTGQGLPGRIEQPRLESAFQQIAEVVRDALPPVDRVEHGREVFFQLAPEPCFVMNAEGSIVEANPAWYTLLGLAPGEVFDARLAAHVHIDDQPALAVLRLEMPQKETVALTFRVRGRGGEWRSLSTSVRRAGTMFFCVARETARSPIPSRGLLQPA